jgi:hypothetical protein
MAFTGIATAVAPGGIRVFLAWIVMMGTVVQIIENTVTITVRSTATISYFVTYLWKTGIAAMDGAGTAIARVGAGAEEVIIAGIGVVEVDADTETVTFIIGTHVAIGSTLGTCRLVVW